MSLQPNNSFLPSVRTARTVARLSDQTNVGVAVTIARAELEAAKVDAVAVIATKAMQDVALISQVEQSLAQTVPHASGRLATIADLAAVSMAQVVANAAFRIGR